MKNIYIRWWRKIVSITNKLDKIVSYSSRGKKIIYIDMDGVMADYKSAFIRQINLIPEIKYPQSQYGFFANLNPIEDSINSINILREKYNVYILTRPSYLNPMCYTEKRIWIENHFGIEFCKNLIICYDKHLLKGDYLIDDNEHKGFEGEWVHFGSSNYPNWKSVVDFLL